MNRDRFEQILEAYGADPRRWPDAEREAAQAFAAADGAEAIKVATALDAALDLARDEAPPSDLLTARILKQRARATDWRGPALGLAACALLGVVVGFGGGLATTRADQADALLAAALAEPIEDWSGDEG